MAAAETSVAAMAPSAFDRSSGSEKEEDQDEEGGGGTTRRSRPAPLDIAEAQSAAAAAGPATPSSATPKTPRPITRYDKERKLGHRRVDEEGQITYKKIQTTQIMGSIQLGISHAVGGLASKPERDVLMQDFAVVETTTFPGQGSNITPAHHYTDFRFKTYAPVAFRYFRDLFGIQPDDFLLSMCNEPMRELTNPGASGSIFYVTCDDEFIIKTVQHKEGEFLQKLLPGYYMNLNQNPRTLLPKFFGLYCYQCGGKNIRLAVMNNLLPSSIKIHQKYDLKGSTYKRKANKHERSKPSPTFKDLDFMEHHSEGILLEAETYTALVKTIQRDCRVLASFKIMDYSLLVGIHNLDRAHKERLEARRAAKTNSDPNSFPAGTSEADGAAGSGLARSRSINRQRLVAHSTAMEAIQADCEVIDEEEDVPPGGIPARNSKGERLLIYLGIIDILQSYRLKKKLEHTWKAMLHDGDTVSVHRPGFYAQRFQDFMAKTVFKKIPSPLKHSPSRKKSLSMRHRPPSGSEEARAEERDAVVVRDLAASGVGSGPARVPSGQTGSPSWPRTAPVAAAPPIRVSPLPATAITASLEHAEPSFVPAGSRTVRMSSTGRGGSSSSFSSSRSDSGSAVSGRSRSKVPPPVPPRSPRKARPADSPASLSHSDLPVSFTPPPSFDDTLSDTSELKSKARSSTDPSEALPLANSRGRSHERIRTATDRSDVISISQITLKTESLLSTHSESSSTTSSGFSSIVKTCTWTPPHSVEGSTPTHTEGTPSFTESSSSGDLGCPTTPVKSLSRSEQHGVIKTTRTVVTTRIDDGNSGGIGALKSYQETEM